MVNLFGKMARSDRKSENNPGNAAAVALVKQQSNKTGFMEMVAKYVPDIDKCNDKQLCHIIWGIFEGSRQMWRPLELDGKSVDCKKGCAWCCNLNVDVLECEAYYIAELVNAEFPREDRIRISKMFKEQHTRKKDIPHDQREHLRHRCPFLNDDSTCGIYSARPLSCRGMYTTSAKGCEKVCMTPGCTEKTWFWGHPKITAQDIMNGLLIKYLEKGIFGVSSFESFIHDLIDTT